MDIRPSLLNQYSAGFAMLKQCIERCPEDLWLAGEHPRTYWRIAYHAIYYTHLYLAMDLKSFVPWEHHRDKASDLWGRPKALEPYTKEQLLGYLADVAASAEGALDNMDLEAKTCGFSWYKVPKLEHQIVNIRHLGGHVGQLSELLMANGILVDWVNSG